MNSKIPQRLGKAVTNTTELDDKDKRIRKLQTELLQLEIRNSELGREIIHLNRTLLSSAATQLDFKHMIDGGYDGE